MDIRKRLLQRIESVPDASIGVFRFTADVVRMISVEARRWCKLPDDAARFPDMLMEAHDFLMLEVAKRSPGGNAPAKRVPGGIRIPIPPELDTDE